MSLTSESPTKSACFGLDAERLEGALEDRRVRLPPADLGGEDRDVEALRDTQLLEIAMEQVRRVERVGDEAELEVAIAERLEQRVRRRGEHARLPPRGVLRLEEPVELVVVHLDALLAEERAHERVVLDLLERARHPQQREIRIAEAFRHARAPARGRSREGRRRGRRRAARGPTPSA